MDRKPPNMTQGTRGHGNTHKDTEQNRVVVGGDIKHRQTGTETRDTQNME